MPRIITIATVALCLCAFSAPAAEIDGKWTANMAMRGPGGGDREFTVVFDLKSDGAKLGGTVTMQTPRGERTSEIIDGKIDGSKFSFTTMGRGREGAEVKVVWEGALEGGELRGEQRREGGQRSIPFTAKRQ